MQLPKETTVQRLARELADGRPDALAEELEGWLSDSRRFRAFAEAHRRKIRKKLRTATELEARADVRTELRAAHLLLADRRVELAFEAYGSTTGGPDFTATFRDTLQFNIEVTRFRGGPAAHMLGGPIMGKLRQLPPSISNLLVIATEGGTADAFDVAAAVRALRLRADAKEDDLFSAHGLAGSRAFHERLLRLSAVIVWCERAAGAARAGLWVNPSARIPLPERAAHACVTALREG